jgi:hypothetical protein
MVKVMTVEPDIRPVPAVLVGSHLSYCGFIHRYQHRIGALPKMAAV